MLTDFPELFLGGTNGDGVEVVSFRWKDRNSLGSKKGHFTVIGPMQLFDNVSARNELSAGCRILLVFDCDDTDFQQLV